MVSDVQANGAAHGAHGWAPAPRGRWAYGALAALLLAAIMLVLSGLGRPWVGPSGLPRLFGTAEGATGSRALLDGYAVLHGAAGMLLELALRPRTAHWPRGWLVLVAIASSGVWEGVENTPALIALFSDPAAGDAYAGDSIINAIGDTLALTAGFAAALRLPAWLVVCAVAGVEAGLWLAGLDGFIGNIARLLAG